LPKIGNIAKQMPSLLGDTKITRATKIAGNTKLPSYKTIGIQKSQRYKTASDTNLFSSSQSKPNQPELATLPIF